MVKNGESKLATGWDSQGKQKQRHQAREEGEEARSTYITINSRLSFKIEECFFN